MSELTPEPPEDPDVALAGEYVLRLLGPDETAACAAREARDPAFAALCASWRTDFAAFDGAYTEAAPPAALERRVMGRLFGGETSEPTGLARLWRSAGLWRAVAVAAVVAAVVLGRPAMQPPVPGEAPARLVTALASSQDSDFAFLAVYEPLASVLNISRTSGTVAPDQDLQLWVVEDSGPVSLGVLPRGTLARVPLEREQAARLAPGSTLAISVEPLGGSAQPTRVVATGAVSEI
jgi:anti-sigma-K factor RskA